MFDWVLNTSLGYSTNFVPMFSFISVLSSRLHQQLLNTLLHKFSIKDNLGRFLRIWSYLVKLSMKNAKLKLENLNGKLDF